MKVFIMAAGESRRHPMYLKQLKSVGQECIIGRIIRQCYQRGLNPWVVTHHLEIIKIADHYKSHRYMPYQRNWLVETLMSTREMWDELTIILLGDVIYSKDAMDTILSCREKFMWFGDQQETYAIVFSDKLHDKVIKCCYSLIEENLPYFEGTLRQLLFKVANISEKNLFRQKLSYVTRIIDYTRDIDTRNDYLTFNREVIDRRQLDDLP